MKLLLPACLALAVLLTACGGAATPQELLDSAQGALTAGNYEKAAGDAVAAGAAAAASGDDNLAWRAKSVELLALGKQGDGASLLVVLKAAEAKWADKVDPKFLTRLITELDKGNDIPGAIAVLGHGVERFPESKAQFDKFGAMLAEKAKSAGDDAGMKQLQQLGYLGG